MKKVILYGAGYYGQKALKIYGERVAFFCDSRTWLKQVGRVSVIGLEELKKIHCDYDVVITPIDARARSEIAGYLSNNNIPFVFFNVMDYLVHFWGKYPDITYEYETGMFDYRTERLIELYMEMFRQYGEEFSEKNIEVWAYVCDEPLIAYDVLESMGLRYIHAYSTMYPIKNKVIPVPDYMTCFREDSYFYCDVAPIKCKEARLRRIEDNRAFWRGNLTNYRDRSLLYILGKTYPKHLLIESSAIGNNIPMTDQTKYRYLIDIRGLTWTDRVKILLQLGRPVLLVDRPYKEWYFDWLVPMKHYVPVKEDLSDLISQIEYMEAHPALYNEIVQNALEFSEKYLVGKPVLEYLKDTTLQYDVVSEIPNKKYSWNPELYRSGKLLWSEE